MVEKFYRIPLRLGLTLPRSSQVVIRVVPVHDLSGKVIKDLRIDNVDIEASK